MARPASLHLLPKPEPAEDPRVREVEETLYRAAQEDWRLPGLAQGTSTKDRYESKERCSGSPGIPMTDGMARPGGYKRILKRPALEFWSCLMTEANNGSSGRATSEASDVLKQSKEYLRKTRRMNGIQPGKARSIRCLWLPPIRGGDSKTGGGDHRILLLWLII
jgi:hypothetical protein